MMDRRFAALLGTFGAVALSLAPTTTLARSGGAPGGVPAAAGPVAGPPAGHPGFRPGPRAHRGYYGGGPYWPGAVGYYDPSFGPANAAVPPQGPQDFRFTYTYDVPWDNLHRFPPNVVPSNRPYVQECTNQTVSVPRRAGDDETVDVNVMRCY